MPERKRRAYYPPLFTCDAPARYGGLSAARKYSRAELGHMWHCNRSVRTAGERCYQHRDAGTSEPVHWVGDAPTSLHGNGAASFEHTTRDRAEVTCSLCLTLLDREPSVQEHEPGWGEGEKHTDCYYGEHSCGPTVQEHDHTCTCPSGDGSLRCPCPEHPPTGSTVRCPGCDLDPVGYAPHNGKGDCPPQPTVKEHDHTEGNAS